nr:pentapeptide repeat-containing protein [Streptomyces sp. SID4951]
MSCRTPWSVGQRPASSRLVAADRSRQPGISWEGPSRHDDHRHTAPLSAPSWPHCARGADSASDPVGCRGRQVEPYGACLAHLTDADRDTYLNTLASGSDGDRRGTLISQSLLQQLLTALHDPAVGRPCLGDAWFDEAVFSDSAAFARAAFSGPAGFRGAMFSNDASFHGAAFSDDAWFDGVTLSTADFSRVTFSARASFFRRGVLRPRDIRRCDVLQRCLVRQSGVLPQSPVWRSGFLRVRHKEAPPMERGFLRVSRLRLLAGRR